MVRKNHLSLQCENKTLKTIIMIEFKVEFTLVCQNEDKYLQKKLTPEMNEDFQKYMEEHIDYDCIMKLVMNIGDTINRKTRLITPFDLFSYLDWNFYDVMDITEHFVEKKINRHYKLKGFSYGEFIHNDDPTLHINVVIGQEN